MVGVPHSFPYTFHFKKKNHLGEALEELCKETNLSLKNIPIIEIKKHTKKDGLIKIYG